MGDKVRGSISLLVGLFAIYQGVMRYRSGQTDWHWWVEVLAGLVLVGMGGWRITRKPDDPAAERLG